MNLHLRLQRPAKIALFALLSVVALLLILIASAIIILPSQWFRDKVRARMIYEIERVSGGKTEIGNFRFEWTNLTAEVAPFVLHGTEPAGAAPLFRAESIKVGLKIVSMLQRDIDIASVDVQRPELNVLVDETGITNFPKPAIQRPSSKHPIERLVDLAIRDIALRNGTVHYGDRKIPLDVRGRYLNGSLSYDFANPSYRGEIKVSEVTVDPGPLLPMTVALDSRVTLFKNSLRIDRAVMSMKETTVEASGTLEDFRQLDVKLDVRANANLAEVGAQLRLPKPHTGHATFAGKFTYGKGQPVVVAGRVTGQHLAIQQGRIRIQEISLTSDVRMDPKQVALRDTTIHALDGVFRGMIDIAEFKRFKANGAMTGVSIKSLARMAGLRETNFAGTMNGPVEVAGSFSALRDLKAAGRFDVTASQDGVPVRGFLSTFYDGRRNALELGKSYLTLPSTRVDFNGTLGEKLTVKLQSGNLDDLLPAIELASGKAETKLPLQLAAGGSALFDGTVTGPIDSANVDGRVTLTNFTAANHQIDRLMAQVNVTKAGLHVSTFALGQDTLRMTGGADVALYDWRVRDTSALSGKLKIDNARIGRLLADAGKRLPVNGLLNGEATVAGTVADARAEVRFNVQDAEVYGEKFQRIHGELRYRNAGVEVINGVAESGTARILLAGTFEHPPDDWNDGRLRMEVSTQGWTLQRIQNLSTVRPGLMGNMDVRASAIVDLHNGELFPTLVDGDLEVSNLSFEKRALGDFKVGARTSGRDLSLTLAGNLRGSRLQGAGKFQLAGDYPGSGEVSFSPATLSAIQDMLFATQGREPLPLDGYVAGKVSFTGPAKRPELVRVRAELPTVQVVPARRALTARQVAELSLRNAEPVVATFQGKNVTIESAHMVGRDTDLQIGGGIALEQRAAWNLKVNGNLNLGVLQDFDQDLVSSGVAVINASVRGTLTEPNLTGRMELKNASFYLADFPNGLDNANGTIVFDQRRANIEKLTATTGGGTLSLTGFVGFSSEMVYRIQARADSVRIRYPEGVSTAANATLTLTGSGTSSLLSGVVTVLRAGFTPRTDIGSILASAPTPIAAPTTQNEYLRGMQFDIRVETVPNLQFQTSLTSDLQAEADLRVRGTAAKPVVLGRVVISQGIIQFFGNKYTINRGEIGFFNPVRVEPVIDLDLETRVRGVLVNINFSGPLRRLNVSYRSDPPLQSTEIIALLAVGRAPGSNSALGSSQAVVNQGFLSTGTNSLLGQAVAAPISGRLQRFFGVSRLKIDPQLTGLTAVPQARLTIEQQISRDVTLTYVTSLAQANQQIIRLEWDINRTWSVVAVREENGIFGVDFLFKKRFR